MSHSLHVQNLGIMAMLPATEPSASTTDPQSAFRVIVNIGTVTMKEFIAIALIVAFLAGCDDARVASRNLSKAAENFEIQRRIVFYNGITDTYMLTIEGRCAIRDQSKQLEVTCKVNDDNYLKHFLGLSDNVTYFAQQLETVDVSRFHHRITFKPQAIIPDIDFRGSTEELLENASEHNQ